MLRLSGNLSKRFMFTKPKSHRPEDAPKRLKSSGTALGNSSRRNTEMQKKTTKNRHSGLMPTMPILLKIYEIPTMPHFLAVLFFSFDKSHFSLLVILWQRGDFICVHKTLLCPLLPPHWLWQKIKHLTKFHCWVYCLHSLEIHLPLLLFSSRLAKMPKLLNNQSEKLPQFFSPCRTLCHNMLYTALYFMGVISVINIESFGIIGGDKRQLALAKAIALDGYSVYMCGFEKLDSLLEGFGGSCTPGETAMFADCMVLPLPVTKDGHS